MYLGRGSSDNICSDLHRGQSPASESETQAVQALADSLGSRVLTWLSIHTTAYVFLHPFGYSHNMFECNRTPDHEDQVRLYNVEHPIQQF